MVVAPGQNLTLAEIAIHVHLIIVVIKFPFNKKFNVIQETSFEKLEAHGHNAHLTNQLWLNRKLSISAALSASHIIRIKTQFM